MAKKNSNAAGLVLLAKQSGLTSYSSLHAVKKALGTSKVGHTGTLDSFAQGLLVVCVGNLTRLASHITAFDKSYEAVIQFGKETDTLDPTGEVIKTAPLPALDRLKSALNKFKGQIMQAPPAFSALHVDGKRASDLVRQGVDVELEKRPVTVFDSEILEVKFDDDRKVQYARVRFDVSKGTYIRSLARDIGVECGSAAYLAGLLRTKISCFELKDAAAVELLPDFTIDSVLSNLNSEVPEENFDIVVEKVKEKLSPMTFEVAQSCGMIPVQLKKENEKDFYNGRPLKENYFDFENSLCEKFENKNKYAVFTEEKIFAGVISFYNNHPAFEYVIPRTL